MPVYALPDPRGGLWAFDPDGLYLIIRSSVRTHLIRQRMSIVTHDAGFLLPNTYNVEVNWSGFRAAVEAETNRYWAEGEMQLRLDPTTFYGTLVGLVTNAIADNNHYNRTIADCARRSNDSISSVVDNWENALTAARFVRDASATILVVTAGIVAAPVGAAAAGAAGITGISTGTALTTLAVGSTMRGAFTYQDTGNVGSAAVNAVGTFVVGAIGIGGAGPGLTSANQATILIIGSAAQGTVAGTQALVEGKSVSQAAVAATIGAVSQGMGGLIGGRIDSSAFLVQALTGTAIDLAGNAASNAITDRMGATSAQPTPRGNIDFLALPAAQAAAWVSANALCRIR